MKEAGVRIQMGREFRQGRFTSFCQLVRSGSNDVLLVLNNGESKSSFLKRALTFIKENELEMASGHPHSALLEDCIEGWEKVIVSDIHGSKEKEKYCYVHSEMERYYLIDYTIDTTADEGYSWWLRDDHMELLFEQLPDLSAVNKCLRDHLWKRRLNDLITSVYR